MVVRNLIIILVAVVLLIQPPLASATVATGAVTGRGVYTLSASGAAAVGSAEITVAKAVRLLGALGRVAGTIGLAFVVYDIASNTWDWWQQNYESGAVGTQSTTTGSWGLTAINNGGGLVFTQSGYGYVLCGPASPWPGVKQWVLGYQPSFANVMTVGAVTVYQGGYDCYTTTLQLMAAPAVSGAGLPAAGASGRDDLLGTIDALVGEINAGTFEAGNGSGQAQVAGTQEIKDALLAARTIVSNGVSLPSGGTTSINSGASVGAMPGAVPTTGESTVPDTGAATAAALAAVAAAIAASQAAVVSGLSAVSSAIAASQAAVVSAVQAVASPIVAAVNAIPAAIAASEAAIVSAVQAIAAPIVNAISASQTAVVTAIESQAVGGGAGATQAVESAAAADVARDQAAEAQAAASAPADVICPECVRADRWDEAWGALQSAAMAAPVFGLINRIVVNPVGTIQRVQTVSTSNFGMLTFDLNAWGIDTYIGVVRYVVIFGALIVGYFVIFG